MLTRIRIEVEEGSPEDAVAALSKYEHAIQQEEAKRYGFALDRFVEWGEPLDHRSFLNAELGRELGEEVIEFDETMPGYQARRVVRFTRIDGRTPGLPMVQEDLGEFVPIPKEPSPENLERVNALAAAEGVERFGFVPAGPGWMVHLAATVEHGRYGVGVNTSFYGASLDEALSQAEQAFETLKEGGTAATTIGVGRSEQS